MSVRGKDVVVREITEHQKKKHTMNDGRARIGDELKEVEIEGLVHKGVGQSHKQGPRIGTQVTIRVATPGDGEGLRGMFSRASSETIYRRFLIPYRYVPERTLALMLDVDHHDKEFLVAVSEEEIIGHAMYVRLGDVREAEMAIIVEDGWQSKGVGKLLLSELAERARLRGIELFTGEVLGTNRRMLGLAAMFAGTGYTIEDSLYHVRMPLRTAEPTAYTAQTLRRAA
jgi:GNAT superfamily N-acetyltransferase